MISPALVEKVGLHHIGEVAKLSREQARAYLYKNKVGDGELSQEDIEELLTLTKSYEAKIEVDYYARRRKCIAALWLLGASWQQIAYIYQVSKPTIVQSAKRGGWAKDRFAEKCGYGRVAEYNAAFWKNTEELESKTPREIASWLLTNVEEDIE